MEYKNIIQAGNWSLACLVVLAIITFSRNKSINYLRSFNGDMGAVNTFNHIGKSSRKIL